jgi:hypothetical protein
MYARLVLPAPGSGIATGVSSACTTGQLRTKRLCASSSGVIAAPARPDCDASVERGV